MSNKSNQSGFTLVEIAIAVAILGLAFTTLVGLHTKMINSYGIERNRNTAAMIGQYILAMIDVSPFPPEVGSDSGDLKSKLQDYGFFDDDSAEWKPEEDIKDWNYALSVVSEGLLDFEDVYRRIELKISWGDADDESFDLVYFVFTKSYRSGSSRAGTGLSETASGGSVVGGGVPGLATEGAGFGGVGTGGGIGNTSPGVPGTSSFGNQSTNPYESLLNANR